VTDQRHQGENETGGRLILCGASTRAAAFSALRAGLRPLCFDLFADSDLAVRCPVTAVPPERYPHGLREMIDRAPPGPWAYTGALENHPELVQAVAARRPLWGNDAATLRAVRDPLRLGRGGWLGPRAARDPDRVPRDGSWLIKPLRGGGGKGIRRWTGEATDRSAGQAAYFQEFVPGPSVAAVYVGDGHEARLLGVTRQLVGESWLHARPFAYCGSIGPVSLSTFDRGQFVSLGGDLARAFDLRGVFGVDAILTPGGPAVIEVNPRYTASVEVLEYATGLAALALHRDVFEGRGLGPPSCPPRPELCVGKGILFASGKVALPDEGPWLSELGPNADLTSPPRFADIPQGGAILEAGWPVMSLFAVGREESDCLEKLREMATTIDSYLRQPTARLGQPDGAP
jgi:predicted ATP-grasp superfamily ATP-dependent carboligase